MRIVAYLSLLTSLALGTFAWWGTSTAAGRARYDEMDGLYPLGAGISAAMALLIALAFCVLHLRRSRRTRSTN